MKRQSELTEITGTVGSVFLGLTIGCCPLPRPQVRPPADDRLLPPPVVLRRRRSSSRCRSPRKAEQEAYEAAKKAVAMPGSPLCKKRMAAIEAPYRKALKEQKQAMLTPPNAT